MAGSKPNLKIGRFTVKRYLVESPHTPEECLRSLDEVLAMGRDRLAQCDFACAAGGVHTAWAIVDADSESAARNNWVPSFLRSKARIVEVGKFTPEQIESYHKK